MESNKNQKKEKSYIDQIHTVGRWSSVISIITFILNGVIICAYFNIFPEPKKAVISIALAIAIMLITGVTEFFSQLPILGSAATYISYITGNISNMKVPAISALMQVFPAEDGSEEKEVLGTIAACISSLFVIILLTAVVLFSGALTPILEWEPIQPSFTYIMPVLYGILLVPSLATKAAKYVLISMAVVAVLVMLGVPGVVMSAVGIPVALVLFFGERKLRKGKESKK